MLSGEASLNTTLALLENAWQIGAFPGLLRMDDEHDSLALRLFVPLWDAPALRSPRSMDDSIEGWDETPTGRPEMIHTSFRSLISEASAAPEGAAAGALPRVPSTEMWSRPAVAFAVLEWAADAARASGRTGAAMAMSWQLSRHPLISRDEAAIAVRRLSAQPLPPCMTCAAGIPSRRLHGMVKRWNGRSGRIIVSLAELESLRTLELAAIASADEASLDPIDRTSLAERVLSSHDEEGQVSVFVIAENIKQRDDARRIAEGTYVELELDVNPTSVEAGSTGSASARSSSVRPPPIDTGSRSRHRDAVWAIRVTGPDEGPIFVPRRLPSSRSPRDYLSSRSHREDRLRDDLSEISHATSHRPGMVTPYTPTHHPGNMYPNQTLFLVPAPTHHYMPQPMAYTPIGLGLADHHGAMQHHMHMIQSQGISFDPGAAPFHVPHGDGMHGVEAPLIFGGNPADLSSEPPFGHPAAQDMAAADASPVEDDDASPTDDTAEPHPYARSASASSAAPAAGASPPDPAGAAGDNGRSVTNGRAHGSPAGNPDHERHRSRHRKS